MGSYSYTVTGAHCQWLSGLLLMPTLLLAVMRLMGINTYVLGKGEALGDMS